MASNTEQSDKNLQSGSTETKQNDESKKEKSGQASEEVTPPTQRKRKNRPSKNFLYGLGFLVPPAIKVVHLAFNHDLAVQLIQFANNWLLRGA